MRIRGNRRCEECGREWSYFDTGSAACPACGSLRSVGTDDRKRHTDGPVELDIAEYRTALDGDIDLGGVASDLKTTLRDYIRQRGFINGGELRTVDNTVLAAAELLHAVDVVERSRRPPDDAVQLYLLDLLAGADAGDRPAPESVPGRVADARGLAYAEVLDRFCTDLGTWLDDNPDPEARQVRETLDTHVRRVLAVNGDVPLDEVEGLVRAAREVATYLTADDEAALVAARELLLGLR